MIIVKIDRIGHVVEKAMPCIVLSGELVTQIMSNSQELQFEPVTSIDKSTLPGPNKELGLFSYPDGKLPSLIADEYKTGNLWCEPIWLFLFIYDTRIDASKFVGGVYSVMEV